METQDIDEENEVYHPIYQLYNTILIDQLHDLSEVQTLDEAHKFMSKMLKIDNDS